MAVHTEVVADLLQQVRAVRSLIERSAAKGVDRKNSSDYASLLMSNLDQYLASPAVRERVIAYASAAELGVFVEPPQGIAAYRSEQDGQAVRILFWATWKRMLGMQRRKRPGTP